MESGSMNMGEEGLGVRVSGQWPVVSLFLSPPSSPSTLLNEGKTKEPAGG
jgi:hypothetical protein